MSGEMHAKACCNHDAHHPGRALQPRQGTQPCLDRRKMHRHFAHLARHDRATQPETTGPAESNMTWHRSGISMVEAWQRHWHPSAPSKDPKKRLGISISIDQHRHQRRHLQHMAWRRLSLHIRLRAAGSAIPLANLLHCHGNPSPQLGRVYVWAPRNNAPTVRIYMAREAPLASKCNVLCK